MTNEEDKAISLQEAINAMQALQDEDIETYGVHIPECFNGDRAIEALKQLKPVRFTEKAGHWTEDIDKNRRWDRVRFYCSECGAWQTYGKTEYCPNCGAKMGREG